MKQAFSSLILLTLALSPVFAVSADEGSEVRGGDSAVCDAEKEAVFVSLLAADEALAATVAGLKKSGFEASCTTGNSQLIAPVNGIENSAFFIAFQGRDVSYSIALNYSAQRANLPANYRGHVAGENDGTVLKNAELTSFVVQKKAKLGF